MGFLAPVRILATKSTETSRRRRKTWWLNYVHRDINKKTIYWLLDHSPLLARDQILIKKCIVLVSFCCTFLQCDSLWNLTSTFIDRTQVKPHFLRPSWYQKWVQTIKTMQAYTSAFRDTSRADCYFVVLVWSHEVNQFVTSGRHIVDRSRTEYYLWDHQGSHRETQ